MEEASAGPIGQFRHHVRLAKLFRHSVQRADPGGKHRPCKGFRNVASRGARVQPARVNCVDHHVCARGAVDDFRRLPRRKRCKKSRRHQHNRALPGQHCHASHDFFHPPKSRLVTCFPERQHLVRGRLGQVGRSLLHSGIVLVCAFESVLRRSGQRLVVALVHNQIGLIKTDLGATRGDRHRQGTRNNPLQGLCQLSAVICKILLALHRGREKGHPVRWLQRLQKLCCRLPRHKRILHRKIQVVKQHGRITLDQHWRIFVRRRCVTRGSFRRPRGLRVRAGPLHGKRGDHLRFAFVEQPEIFLVQRADRVPLRITRDDSDQHQVHSHFEGRRRVVRGDFGDWPCCRGIVGRSLLGRSRLHWFVGLPSRGERQERTTAGAQKNGASLAP